MNLFTCNTPLAIRFRDGSKSIMVEYFQHADGLLFFEPFWNTTAGYEPVVIKGEVKGDGPWKVGDCVITVLACHGCDAELALVFADWQNALLMQGDDYPDRTTVQAIARKYGAIC